MILVLGASGTVGGHLLAKLEARGLAVRAATRRAVLAEAQSITRTLPGTLTERVLFDLERPETFAPALAGVERVFMIARPGDEQADRVARPFIDAMKRHGVRAVVNLTAMGAEVPGHVPALRAIERYLEDSGLAFTHLRPNFFMQIFAAGPLFAQIKQTGALRVPAGQAKLSFIDARDVAAVAECALTDPSCAGNAYTLTGDEAIDHTQVADAITRATGRSLRYIPIEEDEARAALARSGVPSAGVERLIRFYRLVREGACAPLSPAVRNMLRRPATSFERFARDHVGAFVGG